MEPTNETPAEGGPEIAPRKARTDQILTLARQGWEKARTTRMPALVAAALLVTAFAGGFVTVATFFGLVTLGALGQAVGHDGHFFASGR